MQDCKGLDDLFGVVSSLYYNRGVFDQMNEKPEKDIGVYYNKKDYASLLKRIIAAAIDTLVLLVFVVLISVIWSLIFMPPNVEILSEYGWLALVFFSPAYFWFCTLIAYLYLAILKRSAIRTLGYRITKIKIITMKGKRPSILQMTWRFVLLVFGPIHILVDLFWLGGDDDRQALRDKFARTYVVAVDSSPTGSGAFVFANYNLLGFSFLFREVKRMGINKRENQT